MSKILGFEKAVAIVGEFKFSEYRKVLELRFYQDAEVPSAYNVDMVLESEQRGATYRLFLRFKGVTSLKVSDFGGAETRVIGLDIVNISDRQWDGVRWEVIDYEHDALHFYAGTAEIVSVTRVQ